MGSTSRSGRATINPAAPEALGICDGCGFLFNLRALRWQYEWCGTNLQNLHYRKCSTCLDVPNEQLRTIILPPDPRPVSDPRTEPFSVDQANDYTLQKILGKPAMFASVSNLACVFGGSIGLPTEFVGASNMTGTLGLDIRLAPVINGASNMVGALLREVKIAAAVDGASNMVCDVTRTAAGGPAHTLTDSFQLIDEETPFTETAAAIGSAAADRLVFVVMSGFKSTDAAFVSVTIGGVSATQAVAVRRSIFSATGFAEIWWAAVPTGTTGNIVVTGSGGGESVTADVAVYKVTGANTTVPIQTSNTGSVASGNVSAAVTITASSVTLAGAMVGISSTDANVTFTNITEDYEYGINFGAFLNGGVASRADVAAPGSTTITASVSAEDLATDKVLAIVVLKA